MTYSGLLLLIVASAVARLLFDTRDRAWTVVVMPALIVALVLTFTRSAWVGTCVVVALLFSLKDFRLVAAIPVVAALIVAVSPPQITSRFYSMFDLRDPTSRDRVAMLREGVAMIEAHPLTGVGPNMVQRVYEQYRDPTAVERVNPHLHNVPMQIAAERGLPALGAWLVFVGIAALDLWKIFRRGRVRCLSAAGLAAIAGMLAAGLFEYNFGDSEFLMLFLVLLTLPFAAERSDLP
jgi:O-antigen ligase